MPIKAKSARAKGDKLEKKVAKLFEGARGWAGRRQPGSGKFIDYPHDCTVVDPLLRKFIIECKKRKTEFATFGRWLGRADMLVVEANRGEPYIYMKLDTFLHIVDPLADVPEDCK